MPFTPIIAVFGYNNTRLYDLLKIRDVAQDRLGAQLLLVKEGITDEDRKAAHHCLDFSPENPEVVRPLEDYLQARELKLLGCLPFSDKGVIGGAFASRHFGLTGDGCETSFAMLDKSLFRELEKEMALDPANYKKPFFTTATSEAEIREVLGRVGPFFIKPVAEGNSRGCMKIESAADLDQWLKENPAAPRKGVMCEEILAERDEFSFDGVAGSYWITQKFTTSGSYRAEYQHIVPAPFETEKERSLHQSLQALLPGLGSFGGAIHHEFFLLEKGQVASVEPNRRPAGMWIWDLAAWAFEGFDPWSRWIDWCTGVPMKKMGLRKKAFAGVRGVISNRDGVLKGLDRRAIEAQLKATFGDENVRISFLKEVGSAVRARPRDNSDFLAFIALKNPEYPVLVSQLERANEIFAGHLEIES